MATMAIAVAVLAVLAGLPPPGVQAAAAAPRGGWGRARENNIMADPNYDPHHDVRRAPRNRRGSPDVDAEEEPPPPGHGEDGGNEEDQMHLPINDEQGGDQFGNAEEHFDEFPDEEKNQGDGGDINFPEDHERIDGAANGAYADEGADGGGRPEEQEFAPGEEVQVGGADPHIADGGLDIADPDPERPTCVLTPWSKYYCSCQKFLVKTRAVKQKEEAFECETLVKKTTKVCNKPLSKCAARAYEVAIDSLNHIEGTAGDNWANAARAYRLAGGLGVSNAVVTALSAANDAFESSLVTTTGTRKGTRASGIKKAQAVIRKHLPKADMEAVLTALTPYFDAAERRSTMADNGALDGLNDARADPLHAGDPDHEPDEPGGPEQEPEEPVDYGDEQHNPQEVDTYGEHHQPPDAYGDGNEPANLEPRPGNGDAFEDGLNHGEQFPNEAEQLANPDGPQEYDQFQQHDPPNPQYPGGLAHQDPGAHGALVHEDLEEEQEEIENDNQIAPLQHPGSDSHVHPPDISHHPKSSRGDIFFFFVAILMVAAVVIIALSTACKNPVLILVASAMDFWIMTAFYWIDVRLPYNIDHYEDAGLIYDAFAISCVLVLLFAAGRAASAMNHVVSRTKNATWQKLEMITVLGLFAQLTVLCIHVITTKHASRTTVAGFVGTVLSTVVQTWHLINQNNSDYRDYSSLPRQSNRNFGRNRKLFSYPQKFAKQI